MAIDQREELIAKVRAQVEKEKAAKAAKLKKEQEAMQLSGNNSTVKANVGDNKPKFKTLSQEELERIEEKKRRKLAAEKGIILEEDKPKTEETSAEESKVETPKKDEKKPVEEPKKDEKKPVEEPKKDEKKPTEEPKKDEKKPTNEKEPEGLE